MASSRHRRRMECEEYATMYDGVKDQLAQAYEKQPHRYVQGAARGAINALLVRAMDDGTFIVSRPFNFIGVMVEFAKGLPGSSRQSQDYWVARWAHRVTVHEMLLSNIGKLYEVQQELKETSDPDQRLLLTKRITRLQRNQKNLREIRRFLENLFPGKEYTLPGHAPAIA